MANQKKIVRLNNEFTAQQLNRIQTNNKQVPKRRYLGLILVAVILVMILPTINLVTLIPGILEYSSKNPDMI